MKQLTPKEAICKIINGEKVITRFNDRVFLNDAGCLIYYDLSIKPVRENVEGLYIPVENYINNNQISDYWTGYFDAMVEYGRKHPNG